MKHNITWTMTSKILKHFLYYGDNMWWTTDQIAEDFGLERNTAHEALSILKSRNLIKCEESIDLLGQQVRNYWTLEG